LILFNPNFVIFLKVPSFPVAIPKINIKWKALSIHWENRWQQKMKWIFYIHLPEEGTNNYRQNYRQTVW